MNRADLRTRTLARLADAGVSYPESAVNAALEDAQQMFAFLTLCVERTREVKTDAAMWQITADLPDFLLPLRVRCRRYHAPEGVAMWNQPVWDEALFDESSGEAAAYTETPVRPATLSQLDACDRAWRLAHGPVVERYGCQGHHLFFVHPTPEDEEATTLSVTYAAQPAPLADNVECELPRERHPAVISGALALLPLAFGGAELQRFEHEWISFLTEAKSCADYVRARSRGLQYDNLPAEIRMPDVSRRPRSKEPAS